MYEDSSMMVPLQVEDKQLRKEVVKAAKNFNLSAPISEEEFDDALHKLATYLLFGTSWDPRKQVRLPKRLPILSDIPLVCHGKKCKYAQVCPVLEMMSPSDIDGLEGTKCRADKILGVQHFTDLVKDLKIEPTQTMDILNLATMVRWMIYRRRIDWQLSLEGITIDAVNAYDARTKVKMGELKEHPLMKTAERVDGMIEKIGKSLIASRKDRYTMAAAMGEGKDILKQLFLDQTKEEGSSLPEPEDDEDEL